MKTLEKLLPFVSGAIYIFPIAAILYTINWNPSGFDQSFSLIPISVIFAVLGSLFILLVNYKNKKSKLYYFLGGLVPGFIILGMFWPFFSLIFGF